jgi:hypothetical protein
MENSTWKVGTGCDKRIEKLKNGRMGIYGAFSDGTGEPFKK